MDRDQYIHIGYNAFRLRLRVGPKNNEPHAVSKVNNTWPSFRGTYVGQTTPKKSTTEYEEYECVLRYSMQRGPALYAVAGSSVAKILDIWYMQVTMVIALHTGYLADLYNP